MQIWWSQNTLWIARLWFNYEVREIMPYLILELDRKDNEEKRTKETNRPGLTKHLPIAKKFLKVHHLWEMLPIKLLNIYFPLGIWMVAWIWFVRIWLCMEEKCMILMEIYFNVVVLIAFSLKRQSAEERGYSQASFERHHYGKTFPNAL